MPLIQLLEVRIVVGVLLWLVNRFIPMQSTIKSILNVIVIIAVVLWLLNVFGLFHSLSSIHVGKGLGAGIPTPARIFRRDDSAWGQAPLLEVPAGWATCYR